MNDSLFLFLHGISLSPPPSLPPFSVPPFLFQRLVFMEISLICLSPQSQLITVYATLSITTDALSYIFSVKIVLSFFFHIVVVVVVVEWLSHK